MLISPRGKGKGVFLVCMFVFVLGTLENVGFVANMVTMVLYFKIVMHFDLSASSNTLTNFMGSVWLLPLLGGFISDTFLNRLQTWSDIWNIGSTGFNKSLHPDPCRKSSCVKGGKAAMFYASLCLLAVGSGGVQGSLPALGADQFDRKDQKGGKLLASYFNWYLLNTTIGSMVEVTVVVWVSMNRDWYWGFLIGTVTAVVGFIFLAIGNPFYCFQPLGSSPIVKIAQVIVAAIRNRRLSIPTSPDELYEIDDEDGDPSEEKIPHTSQFRSLDKAAILLEGMTPKPWKACTVTQVEEVNILTRMLPIIGSTIIMNTCMAQLQTFSVHQGYFMDPYICSFKFPISAIPVIPLFFMSLLIPIYEFLVVPFARKINGHPSGITQLQRVGVGLVLSIISMAVAAIVEVKRRNHAHRNPLQPLSLFWLSFQYGIFGIADMFTIVGLMEFFYKEAPSGMRSLSTSFTYLSLSFGYFLSSIFVDLINSITKKITPSKQGWLHGNNLNLFYWFLAILSTLNLAIYLYCAS
ncbi:hypothetical protein I3760_13G146400 [Carya illinoinensis]|nr:hypothetical protein I3760_13G146400 [Carya illinoinensis]